MEGPSRLGGEPGRHCVFDSLGRKCCIRPHKNDGLQGARKVPGLPGTLLRYSTVRILKSARWPRGGRAGGRSACSYLNPGFLHSKGGSRRCVRKRFSFLLPALPCSPSRRCHRWSSDARTLAHTHTQGNFTPPPSRPPTIIRLRNRVSTMSRLGALTSFGRAAGAQLEGELGRNGQIAAYGRRYVPRSGRPVKARQWNYDYTACLLRLRTHRLARQMIAITIKSKDKVSKCEKKRET